MQFLEIQKKSSKGIGEVLKIIWRPKVLRDYVVVYLLTNGVGPTKNILLIFYIESTWSEAVLE